MWWFNVAMNERRIENRTQLKWNVKRYLNQTSSNKTISAKKINTFKRRNIIFESDIK